jgi:hypothetical protein
MWEERRDRVDLAILVVVSPGDEDMVTNKGVVAGFGINRSTSYLPYLVV